MLLTVIVTIRVFVVFIIKYGDEWSVASISTLLTTAELTNLRFNCLITGRAHGWLIRVAVYDGNTALYPFYIHIHLSE